MEDALRDAASELVGEPPDPIDSIPVSARLLAAHVRAGSFLALAARKTGVPLPLVYEWIERGRRDEPGYRTFLWLIEGPAEPESRTIEASAPRRR